VMYPLWSAAARCRFCAYLFKSRRIRGYLRRGAFKGGSALPHSVWLVLLVAFITLTAGKPAAAQIILTDGVKKVRVSYTQLGARKTADKWKVDYAKLKKTLARLAPRFTASPRNASVAARGNRVKVFPSAAGRKLDVSASAHRVAALLQRGSGLWTVSLVVRKRPAKITTAMVKPIRSVLSRFSTQFNPGNRKRAFNLRLAAKRVNGKLLLPGRMLSVNHAVGPRTQENGFLTAPVIEYGKKVPGIGGGASQVAGTLFNAALLAGLSVPAYQTHARPVPYLPVGRDATLSEQIDLKIKNTSKAPVYIAARPQGSRLVITIYGATVRGRNVGLMVKKEKPAPTHVKAELFRIVKQDGMLVREERIGRSEYMWKEETAKSLARNAK
jgi:vancomycin resistance protein YoaR